MAVYDHEEQEQLEELKAWWKLHGTLVTAVVVILAVASVSWQGWNWWQRKQSGEAAAIYAALQRAASGNDAKRTRELAGELIDRYGSTNYAAMGAMMSGRVQAESGDLKNARAQLQWAVTNTKDDALRDVARLRLAVVLLEDKDYAEASRQLADEPATAGFSPRFSEMRGDVLAIQGREAEARAAYEAALGKLGEKVGSGAAANQDPYREMVQNKLDATPGKGSGK